MDWDLIFQGLLTHPYGGAFPGVLRASRRDQPDLLHIREEDGSETYYHMTGWFKFCFTDPSENMAGEERRAVYDIDLGLRVARLQTSYLIDGAMEMYHDITWYGVRSPKRFEGALRKFGGLGGDAKKVSCSSPPRRTRDDLVRLIREMAT